MSLEDVAKTVGAKSAPLKTYDLAHTRAVTVNVNIEGLQDMVARHGREFVSRCLGGIVFDALFNPTEATLSTPKE